MRDIVERLLGEAELIERGGIPFEVHLPPLLNDAANEVGALRKTLLLTQIEFARMSRDNEILREKLRETVEGELYLSVSDGSPPGSRSEGA